MQLTSFHMEPSSFPNSPMPQLWVVLLQLQGSQGRVVVSAVTGNCNHQLQDESSHTCGRLSLQKKM